MAERLRVGIVGSGPAGLYAAGALLHASDAGGPRVRVDVLDRLPAPYGLLRYGVAPDHLKMKSLVETFRPVLERPEVRFLGGVDVGGGVPVEEVRSAYDAVVYATGSQVDRRMGIPGEDLPGSYSATDLVAWYSGHPDAALARLTLDARAAVVVGAGNVAVDVARVLAKTGEAMRHTDVTDEVLATLSASAIRDVHLVARRGALQARFTPKELHELGEIPGTDVVVDAAEVDSGLDPADLAASPAQVRRNVDVLRSWAARPAGRGERRLHLHFWTRPVELGGAGRVERVVLERTAPGPGGAALPTGRTWTLPAQLVVRAVGYWGSPLPGVPFDPDAGVIPNAAGRVLRDGAPSPGEYAVGWAKRGPHGVIGTNRADAAETVRSLLADLDGRAPGARPDLLDRLRSRGVPVVTWEGWQLIDAAERALGAPRGADRVKIATREGLLASAGHQVRVPRCP